MEFGLSTSWNAFRFSDGKSLIFEIKNLGFKEVELSFNLTERMVREIEEVVRAGGINVVSVHNYCPTPKGVPREKALPDFYAMSSLDSEERKKAVAQTCHTIACAKKLGAKAVVLHCGRVEIPDITRALIERCAAGEKDSRQFRQTRDVAVRKRQRHAKPFFNNTLKSLEEINRFAGKENILLGIENRFYYREIPTLEEIGSILQRFQGSRLFYWHDTGHAHIMECLGFARHKDFLDLHHPSLKGIHLHDVAACRDHKAPGTGEIDFSLLTPYLKTDILKIVEAHHPTGPEELKQSKRFLEKLL